MSTFANSVQSLVSLGSRLFPHDSHHSATPATAVANHLSHPPTHSSTKEYQEALIALKEFFDHNPESWKVLWEFRSYDPLRREECFQSSRQLLLSWYHGFGSPKEASMLQNPEELVDFSHWGDTGMFYLIHEQTPDLLRLQCTAPLKDVRVWCSQLLGELQSRGLPIPRPIYDAPSHFTPWSELTHLHGYLDDSSSVVTTLFIEHFAKYCRVENYLMVMAFHPEYLESYLKFHHHLIGGDYPLPFADRHYICVLAAARHRCTYLVRLHVMLFLLHGGQPSWLHNPDEAPKRLQNLREINRILAHRPWLITPNHIESLSRTVSGAPESTYSLSELTHAVALLCHTHALCSFVFGCGVSPELDAPAGHTFTPVTHDTVAAAAAAVAGMSFNHNTPSTRSSRTNSAASSSASAAGGGGFHHNGNNVADGNGLGDGGETSKRDERIHHLLKVLSEVMQKENQDYREDEVARRFLALAQENSALSEQLHNSSSMSLLVEPGAYTAHAVPFGVALIERFLPDPEFHYVAPKHLDLMANPDVATDSQTGEDDTGFEIFRTLDFNWEDDGVTIADNCLNDLGFLFNERFANMYDLTYCSLWGQFNVDTGSYRRAVWNYVHSVYFIRHDDYNYVGVEALLSPSMRQYLHRVAVAPHTVTQQHYLDDDMHLFTPGEKVHLNLLVMEARLQASLLYALHAIKRSSL